MKFSEKMDVKFYEVFHEEEIALKKYLPENIKACFTWKTIQEEGDELLPAPVISIRTQSRLPVEWASQIKGLLTRSQGFDHILSYQGSIPSPIPAGYLDNYCSRSVAEHAIMVMLCLMRRIKKQMIFFETFQRDHITGIECRDRQALVLGVGRIGTEIVRLARGLNMDVRGVDLVHRLGDLIYTTLDEGILWADVIFCALPLTDLTRGLLSYDKLRLITKKIIIINISRGEITPLQDLDYLMNEEKLIGLGLDVFEEEEKLAETLRDRISPTDKSRMIMQWNDRYNVIFTPHNAFNTEESVDRKARLSIDSICSFLKQGHFIWPVPN